MKPVIIREDLPKIICGIFMFIGYAACGFGQIAPHTLTAIMHTPPSGPNSPFTVDLVMSPSDVDISGLSILIGYKQDQGTFLFAEDITGQDDADPFFTYGSDTPYDGTTYTATAYSDIYVPLLMDTEDDLIAPSNLLRLHFETSSSYNQPNNNFYVHIGAWALSGPEYGGLIGTIDVGFERIPTNFVSLEPPATSVNDWILY